MLGEQLQQTSMALYKRVFCHLSSVCAERVGTEDEVSLGEVS